MITVFFWEVRKVQLMITSIAMTSGFTCIFINNNTVFPWSGIDGKQCDHEIPGIC